MNNLPSTLDFVDNDPDALFVKGGLIDLVEIWPNTGQIPGVPKNPRYIDEKGVQDLNNSIKEHPKYLIAHPLVLFPYAGAYVLIEGNMRRQSCVDNGMKKVPAVVLNPNTPPKDLIAYMIKGNVGYGKWDYDILANEYVLEDLVYYGLNLPEIDIEEEKEETVIKEPEVTLTLHFKGNLDQYEPMKEKILNIIEKFPAITLTE